MSTFVIRAVKGDKHRRAEAETREQAEIVATTWWRFLWREITINDIPWRPEKE